MKWMLVAMLVGAHLVAAPQPPAAQSQKPTEPTEEQLRDPENYLRPSEPLPPLKLEYFSGKWTFEWEVPDSVFGAGGTIKGTEIYGTPSADGKFIESDTDATGPAGSYKIHAIVGYNEAGHVLTRVEKDSRGFETVYIGRYSTDQGFYLINFDGSAFTFQGQSIRMKLQTSLMGPGSYRQRVTMATGPNPRFTNYGNPWWRRDGLPPTQLKK